MTKRGVPHPPDVLPLAQRGRLPSGLPNARVHIRTPKTLPDLPTEDELRAVRGMS